MKDPKALKEKIEVYIMALFAAVAAITVFGLVFIVAISMWAAAHSSTAPPKCECAVHAGEGKTK